MTTVVCSRGRCWQDFQTVTSFFSQMGLSHCDVLSQDSSGPPRAANQASSGVQDIYEPPPLQVVSKFDYAFGAIKTNVTIHQLNNQIRSARDPAPRSWGRSRASGSAIHVKSRGPHRPLPVRTVSSTLQPFQPAPGPWLWLGGDIALGYLPCPVHRSVLRVPSLTCLAVETTLFL